MAIFSCLSYTHDLIYVCAVLTCFGGHAEGGLKQRKALAGPQDWQHGKAIRRCESECWPYLLCFLFAVLKHPGSEVTYKISFVAVFQYGSYIYDGSWLGNLTRTGQG